MTSTVSKIIKAARAEVGYHEGRSGGHWNNKEKYAAQVPGLSWVSSGGYPWCAVFVCWAFNQAGALDLIPGGATAAVEHFRDYAKQQGRFSEYPAIGAIALFGPTGGDHTGIVIRYDDTYIWTIEGNTNLTGSAEGDGVYLRKRARRDANVFGYAYPKFPEGIVSADPALVSERPKVDGPASRGKNVDDMVKAGMKAARIAKRRQAMRRYKVLRSALDLLDSLKGK